MPYAGIVYTRMFGVTEGYEISPDQVSNFSIDAANYLIPLLGVRYTFFCIMERGKIYKKRRICAFSQGRLSLPAFGRA